MKNFKIFFLILLFSFAWLLILLPNTIIAAEEPSIYSGSSTKGVYNYYATSSSQTDTFGNTNYSQSFTANTTISELENVTFYASKIDSQIQEMRTNSYNQNITTNITTHDFPTEEENLDVKPVYFAQYVKIDNLSLINYVRIYYNVTLIGGFLSGFIYYLNFYRVGEEDGSPVNRDEHYAIILTEKNPFAVGWLQINFGEFLDPGEYYAVIKIKLDGLILPNQYNNNSWQIHEYETPVENAGPSMFKNSTGWHNITNDDTADFLLQLNMRSYYEPETLDVHAYINNELFPITFIRDPTVYTYNPLKPIISGKISHYFNQTPTQAITINVTINQSIPYAETKTMIRFIHIEDVKANYTLTHNTINWTAHYKKINSSANNIVFFCFPNDWTVDSIFDSTGQEILEYGILYSYIYDNSSFDRPVTGILIEDGGDGQTTFEYNVVFHSLNYMRNPIIYTSSIFSPGMSQANRFYSGDTVRFELALSGDREISDGNISYSLLSPFNVPLDIGSFHFSNGKLVSDSFNTLTWSSGTYSLAIFWTDGTEVGYLEYIFVLEMSPWWSIILILVIISLSSVISYRYVRKRLRQRNWQKKIEYLFVMNKKDGRPLYHYSFGGKIEDPTLISGMLTAISSFVKEAIKAKSSQLAVLDQEDKKVIIMPGEYADVVIVAEQNLSIIRKNGANFIRDFENQYHKYVKQWTGETRFFKDAEKLILKHFPITMKDKIVRQVGVQLIEIKEKLLSLTNIPEVITLLRETGDLVNRYLVIVQEHYGDLVDEIKKIAGQKIKM